MTYIAKPKVHHPSLKKNALGLTRRDYEGAITTLCAGCGHDSITAAIVHAFWELDIAPHTVAKLSGIGCSSKTPAYFLKEAHGFNSVHGRMPAIATGAGAANHTLTMIGVSGDGDSLSIGLGQLCHAVRRNVNMLYVLENNGVYGLTKGQFSASADPGSMSKKGEANTMEAIDSGTIGYDDVVTVSSDEICAATKDIFEDARAVAEQHRQLAGGEKAHFDVLAVVAVEADTGHFAVSRLLLPAGAGGQSGQ